jgi:hypothetical protein
LDLWVKHGIWNPWNHFQIIWKYRRHPNPDPPKNGILELTRMPNSLGERFWCLPYFKTT